MLKRIIQFSMHNALMVVLVALLLAAVGLQSLQKINIDAIPDLSDVQVIVKTQYPGQSPEQVEQQVTYPLSGLLMSVPGVTAVRGYSFYSDSYVYVIFDDDTDMYWARARVMEYLSQAKQILPDSVSSNIGPDASGVGWIYQYALTDTSGTYDLAQLKSLQDFYLKPELQSVAGVSEIASVGGMINSFQVELDPLKLARYKLTTAEVVSAIQTHNGEIGAGVMEQAETEFMLRVRGYLSDIGDFEKIPLPVKNQANIAVTLKDVAIIHRGPVMRRGIAELDGKGEVVGGIVVMRSGENAQQVIQQVKAKIEQLSAGLPQGVSIKSVYDRSQFIQASVDHLWHKLLLEMALVAGVLLIFLLHVRSAIVALIILPLSLLMSLLLMQQLSITANIMSLGGIAIAIGALVDAAIVMIENMHKHVEEFVHQHQQQPDATQRWQLATISAQQVGPALFWSLIIITVSFFPVFALHGQEGKLFTPLALTKSFAMAASALLAITLIPVLMGWWVKGKIISEKANPISRVCIFLYRPLLKQALRFPKLIVLLALLIVASAWYPLKQLGYEFMPRIDEGTLMYMPTTQPGISVGKAAQLLQQTDRIIKTLPEVESVFGKIGRADTATDPAPLTMVETTINLKPKSEWREGLTLDDLIAELDAKIQIPGLTNAWVQPIKTRIDMLSTGIKTPLAMSLSGDDPQQLEQIATQVESVLKTLPTTASVVTQRSAQGNYIDIQPRLSELGQYGMTLQQFNQLLQTAVGGSAIGEVIKGKERYPINVRFLRDYRDSVESLKELPIITPAGAYIPLQKLADINIATGPAMLKSENARPITRVLIETKDVSVGEYIQQAAPLLAQKVSLPARYSLSWSGAYQSIERVNKRMQQIIPVTLVIVLLLLFICLQSWRQSLMVLLTLPLAVTGSLWMMWYWQLHFSVAAAVGMIALAGVAAEFGVVMLVYLNQACQSMASPSQFTQAIIAGAVQRIRPKVMTVATIVLSLLPVLMQQGVGYEVMQPIAAPMIGGMILAPLASLFVIPVLYKLMLKPKDAKSKS
ncbi:efflux RND transporter permease subunit [Neptunicella marina]|uniref:Efflux RND transporter permease subunit n=1 Tax=Neptunicella marina TaxID=2125989 RepID=A0A8J6IS86_9ALTE|nr:CusA/CzcA family heavy metal efflux RND transporter [Neptunicella marina]MBC3765329.1 efflux RND transporter permease subunit [Neptunicella marina]